MASLDQQTPEQRCERYAALRARAREKARPSGRAAPPPELNVLVALSNCPHPLSPAGSAPSPVEAVVWDAPTPAPDDLCRHFGEEAERGFENTDAFRSSHG